MNNSKLTETLTELSHQPANNQFLEQNPPLDVAAYQPVIQLNAFYGTETS
jgi:hypothetical protein